MAKVGLEGFSLTGERSQIWQGTTLGQECVSVGHYLRTHVPHTHVRDLELHTLVSRVSSDALADREDRLSQVPII